MQLVTHITRRLYATDITYLECL